jgi:hypothetical protein
MKRKTVAATAAMAGTEGALAEIAVEDRRHQRGGQGVHQRVAEEHGADHLLHPLLQPRHFARSLVAVAGQRMDARP